MKMRPLFEILLVSVVTLSVITVSTAQSTPSGTTRALEVIRKKHDLPALAVV